MAKVHMYPQTKQQLDNLLHYRTVRPDYYRDVVIHYPKCWDSGNTDQILSERTESFLDGIPEHLKTKDERDGVIYEEGWK